MKSSSRRNRSDRGDIKELECTVVRAVAPKEVAAMEVNERWTEIDGRRMRFLQAGSGPPLLLIHGLLGGSFCWRLNLPAFAERFTTYAIDLPGCGESENPHNGACSMQAHADYLASFLSEMGLQQIDILGSS